MPGGSHASHGDSGQYGLVFRAGTYCLSLCIFVLGVDNISTWNYCGNHYVIIY